MQYFICSVVLILICLDSAIVTGLLFGSIVLNRKSPCKINGESNNIQLTKRMPCKSWITKSFSSHVLRAGPGSNDKSLKLTKNCKVCKGKGICACVPCSGSGIDKVNGNIFERWTCNKCKGFGQIPCTCTGEKGLTPEQRGER